MWVDLGARIGTSTRKRDGGVLRGSARSCRQTNSDAVRRKRKNQVRKSGVRESETHQANSLGTMR